MINIGENIEIKSIGSQLILNCCGDFASQETILGETNNGLKFIPLIPFKFSELFLHIAISSLGLINLFQLCVPIGNHFNIYSAPIIAKR